DRRQPVAMPLETLPVILAHGLDPADDQLLALLYPLEADAAGKRQFLLGRSDGLQQMTLEPGTGELRNGRMNRFERRQKIAYQYQLAGPPQRLEDRQPPSCRRRILMLDQLHEPAQRDTAAHRRDTAAEQRQPLATAHQETRERDQDQLGAVAFRRPTGIGDIPGRAVIHRGRGVSPQPDALRCLPFCLTDVKALRFGALAPIDTSCGIARLILPELPEGLALPDPTSAMHPLRHGCYDPLGRNQQRRQNGGRLLG